MFGEMLPASKRKKSIGVGEIEHIVAKIARIPPRKVSRQNVYVALRPDDKVLVKEMAGRLPQGLVRADVADLLRADGADAVIVDDGRTDLAAAIAAATGTAPKLALDAVGGSATGALAAALAVSIVVGVFFGVVPARRAAHLDPVQALVGR